MKSLNKKDAPYAAGEQSPVPEIYAQLFRAFKNAGISWCSWKSNEHLAHGLQARTDVDVLFHPADRTKVESIARDSGFVLFDATACWRYPGIVDFIAVDTTEGRVFHLHAHFLLCAGEKYLKNIIFPWNDVLLDRKIPWEEDPSVPVAAPAIESVFLLTREAIKIRWRDRRGKRPDTPWTARGFTTELDWLRERAADEEIISEAENLLGSPAATVISKMLEQGVTLDRLLRLRAIVMAVAAEKGWRRMGPIDATLAAWLREARWIVGRICEKADILPYLLARRHVLPVEGAIIALLGPDGAGKSTVSRTIVTEWSGKMDVACLYFGMGDGPQSLLQSLLKLVVRIRGHFIQKPATAVPAAATEEPARPTKGTILFALAAVLQKLHLARVAQNLRKRGYIVICDRWPQNQVLGMNDGPLLTVLRDDKNGFLQFLAKWEAHQFEKICAVLKPDLVVRLLPSPETAMKRKDENKGAEALVRRKIDFVRNLPFPGVRDVAVNADLPLEIVLDKVRTAIWSHIQGKPAQRPAFYECAGLSGAGKTAVCKVIYGTSGLSLKPVSSAFAPADAATKAVMAIESFAADPLVYLHAARAAIELELWREPKALECLFRLPVQKRRLAAAAKNERFLLEELLLQNLWSALVLADARSAKPERLAPLIAQLYRGIDPTIFYFKISPEVAARRVSGRTDGKSPYFDNLPEQETAERLRKFAGAMEDVMKAASHAGLRIVTVDASLPLDAIAKKIVLPAIEAGEDTRP